MKTINTSYRQLNSTTYCPALRTGSVALISHPAATVTHIISNTNSLTAVSEHFSNKLSSNGHRGGIF
jgi:hypothetical protein